MKAIGLLLNLFLWSILAQADAPRLLFRVDFEDTVTPTHGIATSPDIKGTPKFAEGLRGKGFVADGSAIIAYPVEGNLNKSRGTVCMWVRPMWAGTDGQNHGFFSDDLDFNDPPQNNLYLWKWVLGDSLRFDIRTSDLRDITHSIASWKPGEWHHLTASWDCETGTQLFADGHLVGVSQLKWQPKKGTKFFIGGDWRGGTPAMATIDEVIIFDSPLNEGQVQRVMNNLNIPTVRILKVQAPRQITPGRAFDVTLKVHSDEAAKGELPISVTIDGLSLPRSLQGDGNRGLPRSLQGRGNRGVAGTRGGVKMSKGETTVGPVSITLPSYYRMSEGEHVLDVTLQGVSVENPETAKQKVVVTGKAAKRGPAQWSVTQEGRVLRNGEVYLAPGEGVAIWYEGQVRPYDREAQQLCAQLVRSGGIVDVIPCKLLDEVQCTATDHGFHEWGKSEVATLGDGRQYRLPGRPETVQETRDVYGHNQRVLPAFVYTLKCLPQPTPHLAVVETIDDADRCLETAIDVAPGSQPSALLRGAGTGATDLINLNVTYTGREYPTDHKPLQQVTLFFPKSDAVEVTISDSKRAAERTAVHRVSVYEITADLDDLAVQSDDRLASGRTVSLFYPWYSFIYEEYGFSSGTEGSRHGSVAGLMQYLRFIGFNRLEFHPYGFSRDAWFDSRLFPHSGPGDIFKDTLPVAEKHGIEVVPRVDSTTFYFSGKGAEKYAPMKEIYQLTRKGQTMETFGTVPDPLHPEVQELLYAILRDMAEQTKGYKNVPAVGFRANGKFGSLYVGVDRAHPPEESGYSEFDIGEFEKDTGTRVGGTAGNAESRYAWLHSNVWQDWIEWRCRRIHQHWLRCRDVIKEVDPNKKLVVFTKIPSNDPGEKRDWDKAPVPLLDLHKYHGYDPSLYLNDSGISLSRVIGVDADRYWPEKWNKLYFFMPELSTFFRSQESSGVELYYIYWELPDHPKGFRVGPGSPRGRAFYEPMTHALRLQNPGHFTFYNWFRATMGHEQDLRQFCRAFRALPMVEPTPFRGRVEPAEAAKDDHLSVRMYGDRIAVINDSAEARTIRLALPAGYGEKGLIDVALNSRCDIQKRGQERVVTLQLRPWDLRTLIGR